MTVQFEQLGDGQVGRLAFQVIGKDGPVFNPNSIKYLSPEQAQQLGLTAAPGSDLIGLAAGLSGLNLLVSTGTLALSASILREVRKISSKLDQLRSFSLETLDRLDSISSKLSVIDVKVSENNLREALKHISQSCHRENTIDLVEIKKLQGDVDNFLNSVEYYGYGSQASFNLSSDVRDRLLGLHQFLFRVRETVARRHNLQSGGDPARTLSVHPIYDYVPEQYSGYRVIPLAISRIYDEIASLEEAIAESVDHRFTFSDEEDDAHFRGLVQEARSRVVSWFGEIDPVSFRLGVALLSQIDDNTDVQTFADLASAWEKYWLLKTDMGLLHRVRAELLALGDYRAAFVHWMRAETKPLGSDALLIDCRWKKTA